MTPISGNYPAKLWFSGLEGHSGTRLSLHSDHLEKHLSRDVHGQRSFVVYAIGFILVLVRL